MKTSFLREAITWGIILSYFQSSTIDKETADVSVEHRYLGLTVLQQRICGYQ